MSKNAKPQNFERALAELEEIVASMEAGRQSLEQLLSSYQRGALLLQFCQQTLQEARQQVQILDENQLQHFPSDNETSRANENA